MTPPARRLLSLLALLPDGVAHEDLETLMPGEADEPAAVLRKVGLGFDQGSRLRVLAPVREYVRRKHAPEEEDLERAVDHYLGIASKGALLGWPGGAEASARLIQELGNLDSMISKGLEREDPETAILAARDLGKFVVVSGWGSRDVLEKAMIVARSSGHEQLEAQCAARLGDIALARSDHDAARACYEEALPFYRNVGDVLGEANCIHSLGNIALERSDYDAARARFEEALPFYRNVGDVLGEANCIHSLGNIAFNCSAHDAARARFEEALPLYRNEGDVLGEADCIHSLGNIALARLDHDAARARYEEALPLFRNVGSVQGEANCITRLGDIALAQSDLRLAGTNFSAALALYGRLSEPNSVGAAHWRLAWVEPAGSEERQKHIRAAKEAWEGIGRPDLVKRWLQEFEEDFRCGEVPSFSRYLSL
jgi:tetratricopeptide (TPR) repeat protein